MNPSLCVYGCGFYGSPSNKNLCSKCYKDIHLQENIGKYDDENYIIESSHSFLSKNSDVMATRYLNNFDNMKKNKKNRCNKKK